LKLKVKTTGEQRQGPDRQAGRKMAIGQRQDREYRERRDRLHTHRVKTCTFKTGHRPTEDGRTGFGCSRCTLTSMLELLVHAIYRALSRSYLKSRLHANNKEYDNTLSPHERLVSNMQMLFEIGSHANYSHLECRQGPDRWGTGNWIQTDSRFSCDLSTAQAGLHVTRACRFGPAHMTCTRQASLPLKLVWEAAQAPRD